MNWKPDFVFVESAWQGYRNSWKYGIAAYPEFPDRTNAILQRMLRAASDRGIPAIFWNKEDDVHYSRFVNSAKLFDFIYTVDENCIAHYRNDVPGACHVGVLMFPVQPQFHYVDSRPNRRIGFSSFVGSYGKHVHPRRRHWQDMMFNVFSSSGLDIYDRNSGRKAEHYRYPDLPGLRVRPKVAYPVTAKLYRSYKYNLNVNTIETSRTMYSRRLIEILAVGGVAVTTPSVAVERLFSNYCHIVTTKEDIESIADMSDREYVIAVERAHAGAAYVAENHTWSHRLAQIEDNTVF